MLGSMAMGRAGVSPGFGTWGCAYFEQSLPKIVGLGHSFAGRPAPGLLLAFSLHLKISSVYLKSLFISRPKLSCLGSERGALQGMVGN